jgi:hypothetical protein
MNISNSKIVNGLVKSSPDSALICRSNDSPIKIKNSPENKRVFFSESFLKEDKEKNFNKSLFCSRAKPQKISKLYPFSYTNNEQKETLHAPLSSANAFFSKSSSLTPRQQTSYEPKLNNLLNSTTRNNYTKLVPNRLSISESSSNPSTNSTNLPKLNEPILPKCSSLIDSFYSRKGFKSNRLITIMELMDNKRNILQKKSLTVSYR